MSKPALRKPTVWVTRTAPPNGRDTAQAWRNAGWQAVSAPVLEIALTPKFETSDIPGEAILILTSVHAVAALTHLTDRRDWGIFCAGQRTAEFAKTAGFKTNLGTGKNADDLAAIIQAATAPGRAPLWHLSGHHVAGDIAGTLTAKGYSAERRVLYQSRPVDACPEINWADITHVALYSPKGAEAFARLCPPEILPQLTAIAISPAVAKIIGHLPLRAQRVASQPHEPDMIKCAEDRI